MAKNGFEHEFAENRYAGIIDVLSGPFRLEWAMYYTMRTKEELEREIERKRQHFCPWSNVT